jgi:hypothetical protein
VFLTGQEPQVENPTPSASFLKSNPIKHLIEAFGSLPTRLCNSSDEPSQHPAWLRTDPGDVLVTLRGNLSRIRGANTSAPSQVFRAPR